MQKALLFIALISLFSCKKQEELPILPEIKGEFILKMDARVGIQELLLGTNEYINAAGDSFTVTTFDYFISNLKLRNTQGNWHTIPQEKSYFLIQESDTKSQQLKFADIPLGDYDAVEFVLGIDSFRSAQTAQHANVPALAKGQAQGMFWNENQGFMFLKFAGKTYNSTNPVQDFKYEIGGYGGKNPTTFNNTRKIQIIFEDGETVGVREGQARTSSAHLVVDVFNIMRSPTKISLIEHDLVGFEPFSTKVADNCAQMFRFDHVENY
jgi:hypothetical protein